MNRANGLQQLEQAIARDLAFLNYPPNNWVPPRYTADGQRVLDVLIVGGGMCGVTAAFHLRRLGIHNIRIVDEMAKGRAGPWLSFARMETLRSPKHLTGPASGMANLTFRAWFEASFGADAWKPLGNIPRDMWAHYMAWFTHITGASVEHHVRLESLNEESGGLWRANLVNTITGSRETVVARNIVLATGREGLAAPRIPAPFAEFHETKFRGTECNGKGVVHTGEAPQRDHLHDKNVTVIGLGASAFDYAAEALEAGARHVTILGRSKTLSRVNKAKQIVYAGFLHGYPLLPDAEKLKILQYIFQRGISPPRGTVQRVMRHDNVQLKLGAAVTTINQLDGSLRLETTQGTLSADLVILGTGYRIDTRASAYMSGSLSDVRLWRDVLPPTDTGESEFLDFPYLGPGFEFLPRTPPSISSAETSSTSAVSRVFCFNHAAMLSLGNLANDIPAVSEGADRLGRAIAAALYLDDKATHLADLHAYEDPELEGDEVPGLTAWWPEL